MILAIDPGDKRSGWVMYADGVVAAHGIEANDIVLHRIVTGWFGRCGTMAIEMIGHYGKGMPAGKTVFDTCIWIGRFVQAWESKDVVLRLRTGPPLLVLRATVKAHICGNAKAKDGNVRQAVIDRLGPPGTKRNPGATHGISGDAWQALALALAVEDGAAGSVAP